MTARVLVAGVGNIFLGDDAFGCEVAQRLLQGPQSDGVRVVDFGIRGLDLAYALLDGYDAAILVDAVPRGGRPGTLYVLEPTPPASDEAPLLEAHGMDPVRVLRTVAALGGKVERLLIVGCEPGPIDADDVHPEMSAAVRAAVSEAVPLVEELVARLLRGEVIGPAGNEGTIPDSEVPPCPPHRQTA